MIVFVVYLLRFKRLIWRLFARPVVSGLGVECGASAVFLGLPVVSLAADSRIVLGERVILCSDSLFTALGVRQRCVLRTLRSAATIDIGDDTGLSGAVICAAERVDIGKGCLIGSGAIIADTDFHPTAAIERRYCSEEALIKASSVWIGDKVFIGAAAIVMKGVRIGSDEVVGAGAVVVRDMAAGSSVAGNPARVVGHAAKS
jgi:acetyltransferase-like isoleucine patch superfamily enzyme